MQRFDLLPLSTSERRTGADTAFIYRTGGIVDRSMRRHVYLYPQSPLHRFCAANSAIQRAAVGGLSIIVCAGAVCPGRLVGGTLIDHGTGELLKDAYSAI